MLGVEVGLLQAQSGKMCWGRGRATTGSEQEDVLGVEVELLQAQIGKIPRAQAQGPSRARGAARSERRLGFE